MSLQSDPDNLSELDFASLQISWLLDDFATFLLLKLALALWHWHRVHSANTMVRISIAFGLHD
jgi:hypothetical protein